MRRNVCGGSAVADPHRPQQHHPTVVLKLAQSMMHSLLAYLLLTLPLGTVQEPDHGCRFPDFLQTDERGNGDDDVWRRRDWRTHLRHALSSDDGVGQQDSGSGVSSAVVVVDGPVMRSAAETYRGLFDGDMSFWNSVRDEATGRNRRDGHRTRRRSHRSRFTYVRECVATVSTGSNVQRFLVEHRTPQDAESSYMCVEFVARSESFVQVNEHRSV
jgi:hypothetical protein